PKLKIDLYTQLAIESFFVGRLEKTLESAYSGIDMSLQNDFAWHEARLRHVLGFVYTQNKLYEEAEEELLKAIHLWEKTGDSLSLYGSRSNLARNSILSGDIKKAKKFFKGNVDFFVELNETLWLARSYMVQSHIQLEENDLDQALNSNKKYDSLLRKLNNPRDRIITYNLFSEIYFLTDEYDKAKQYADSTLYYALQLKDSVELLNGYESLYRMAIEKYEYDEAAKYSGLALPIKEVLDKKSWENNLKILRTKLELEYGQVEKELANSRRLIQQQRITVIVILLLGVLLIILLLVRKIAQKQRMVNAELHEISQTKNKLFSIIGHDLKSPIDTLQELLELFGSQTISEKEISKVLPKLKENVDHSAFTLNNLLFWAKTQMNGLKSNPTSVSIKEKATMVFELYRTRWEKKNMDIHCKIPNHLKVKADSIHLEIILRNIISNAIKFTADKGRIICSAQEKDGMVEISICDSGIGMDKSTIYQLFKNHHMEAKEGTHKEKGTGLGLRISKELIAINDGELKVESKIGKGSHFYILFPVADS
ncbi:MAG: HAMP domain-containing sensor histidine kinase, partial [Bacteroidota bacterium]